MKLTKKEAASLGLHINRPKTKDRHKPPEVQSSKLFDALCAAHGLPVPVPEYEFALEIGRKWRFDWCFQGWLALEKQGALFTEGRHVQPAALVKEYEKLNYAVILGYSVMFCTPDQIADGSIFTLVKQALKARENQA